jgi:hypothetical protein
MSAEPTTQRQTHSTATTIRPTMTGVAFDPLLPYDRWKAVGAQIGTYANATPWWLGDWLLFGRMKYGRRYKEALAVTGLDYQTLRNYAMVARRFDVGRRRRDLTFQHHAAVCALAPGDQERWLDLAAGQRWSRNELRRRLRGAPDRSAPPAVSEVLRVVADAESVGRWRTAAQRTGAELSTWISEVLDSAAADAGSGVP